MPGNPSRKETQHRVSQTGPRTSPDQGGEFNYESHETFTFLPKRDFLGGRHELKTGRIFTVNFTGSAYPSKPSGNYVVQDSGGHGELDHHYNWPIAPRSDNEMREPGAVPHRHLDGEPGDDESRRAMGALSQLLSDADPARRTVRTILRRGPDVSRARTSCSGSGSCRAWRQLGLVGNGKTVLKATFGEYSNQPGLGFASTFNRYAQSNVTYAWHDLNGNRDYDPGEVNLDPSGGDFISASGGKSQLVNPNLQQPHEFEFMTELDRELMKNTAIRLIYVRKEMLQLFDSAARNVGRPIDDYTVPVGVVDPGRDGAVGTADDGGPMTLYTYPTQFAEEPSARTCSSTRRTTGRMSITPSRAPSRSGTSNRWNLLTSFGITKTHEWLIAAAVPQTPNDTLFPLDDTWKWNARATGSYTLPYDIQLSATLLANSGVLDWPNSDVRQDSATEHRDGACRSGRL